MEEKNYTFEDYKKLERHYNSLAMSNEALVKENKQLRDRNEFLEQNIVNAQHALDIQKQVNINAITDMNAAKAKFAEDLQRLQLDKRDLQERIKDLEYDD